MESITFVDAVWRENWKYIPRILFIDATFLKNNIKGTLLVVMGMNGNRKQTPIAINYCQSESADSWRKFLEQLMLVYSDWVDSSLPLTIFSDRLTGLDAVIADLLPHSDHKFCLFHINQNIKQKFKRKLSNIIYETGKSLTHDQFLSNFLEIKKINEEVYNYLLGIKKENWVLCYSEYPNMLYITTSPIESFNKVILKERKKTLVDLIMGIRKICSKSILNQKKKLLKQYNNESNVLLFNMIFDEISIESLRMMYTNYYNKIVDKQLELSTIYTVEQFDSYFTVKYKEKTYIVKPYIKENKIFFNCNCNFTKYSMICCGHVYAIIRHFPMDVSHLVNVAFTLYNIYKICLQTYEYIERPYDEKKQSSFDKPPTKSKGGHPKLNRYKTIS